MKEKRNRGHNTIVKIVQITDTHMPIDDPFLKLNEQHHISIKNADVCVLTKVPSYIIKIDGIV